MQVFICEDNLIQREEITTMIQNAMMIEDISYEIKLVTDNGQDILDYLSQNSVQEGIYFLDIELETEMNGIQLGAEIRKFDDIGRIVYVTSYEHYAPLTFKYRVEAFDYLIKGPREQMQASITQTLAAIVARQEVNMDSKEYFIIKDLYRTIKLDYEKILYFTTTHQTHVIQVVLIDGLETFYSSLRQVEAHSDKFFQVHQSYVVNLANLKEIDNQNREAILINQSRIPVASRRLKELEKFLLEYYNDRK